MGALAALAASLCWAVASILFTRLRGEVGPFGLNLLKCGVALVLIAGSRLVLAGGGPLPGIDAADAFWLAVSGAVGLAVGDSFLFMAFGRIGPRRTLLLSTLTPPFTALLAWPTLGEVPTPRMLGGMALTLAGVAWVIAERSAPAARPDGSGPSAQLTGILAATVWAFCQAVANVLTKVGGADASALDITLVRLAAGTAVLVALVARGEGLRATLRPLRRKGTRLRVVEATFVGTYLGVWLQISGLRYTSHAGVAATLSSTSPLFVLPLAAAFLGDRPSFRAVLGAGVAVLGIGVLLVG